MYKLMLPTFLLITSTKTLFENVNISRHPIKYSGDIHLNERALRLQTVTYIIANTSKFYGIHKMFLRTRYKFHISQDNNRNIIGLI
jgi:hypothetical protein